MKINSLISANRQLDSQLLKTLERNQTIEMKLTEAKDTVGDLTEAIKKIAAGNAKLLQNVDAREAGLAKEVVTMQLEIETLKRTLDHSRLHADVELKYEGDELRRKNDALFEERESLAEEIKLLQSKHAPTGNLDAALLQNKVLNTKLMEAEKSLTRLAMNAQQMQKAFARDLENANAREASLAQEVVSLQLEVEGARRRLAAHQETNSGDNASWPGGDDVMGAKACRK
jgi:chromosome segregation ATPase